MEINLQAENRTGLGKGPARRARAAGKVPAVLYGSSVEPTALILDEKKVWQALHTEAGFNVLINLNIDSASHLTIPREVHIHPIRGSIVHLDFLTVEKDVKISAEVPVHLKGESKGVKEGGQMDHHLHEVRIMALPTDLPPAIDVDVTALTIGDSLHVRDLVPPQGVEITTDPDEMVVGVIQPTVMEVEPAPEEVLEAEPEAGTEEKAEPESSPDS